MSFQESVHTKQALFTDLSREKTIENVDVAWFSGEHTWMPFWMHI